jgi:hypothetical protein
MFFAGFSRSLRHRLGSVAHVVFHVRGGFLIVNIYLAFLWREKQTRFDRGASQRLSKVRFSICNTLTFVHGIFIELGKLAEELLAAAAIMSVKRASL